MRIEVVDVSGAAGVRYAKIVVTNDQQVPCSVQGYPGVQLLGESGAPLVPSATALNGAAERIDLGFGESASTLVQVRTGTCDAPSAAYLKITLAGGGSVQVRTDLPSCQPALRPLVAGSEPRP